MVLVLVMAELVEIVLQCSAPQGYEREQPWNWFRPTPPSPALSDDPRGIKGQRNKWFRLFNFVSRPFLQIC